MLFLVTCELSRALLAVYLCVHYLNYFGAYVNSKISFSSEQETPRNMLRLARKDICDFPFFLQKENANLIKVVI